MHRTMFFRHGQPYVKRHWLSALAICAFAIGPASAAEPLFKAGYGITQAGQPVTQYTLRNAHGVEVKFINYGAVITAIETPDRAGRRNNIALGFSSLADYEKYNPDIHFGALIGRYANRIAAGRFVLDGKTYQLAINDGPNTLHSGPDSFDTKLWSVRPLSLKNAVGAELSYVSPDGENGFPGRLAVHVRYILDDEDSLHLQYSATTDRDTVLNLTNHSYFNLAGEGSGSVEQQQIQIAASRYTPANSTGIPTGELAPVAGTPLDFTHPTPIGRGLRSSFQQLVWTHGYDQNFVLDHKRGDKPAFAARIYDPVSGRQLEVYTTQPGLQFYTANGLNGGVVGSSGKAYRQGDAFALEAEHFPDSPNHPQFPSTRLKPGQIFHEETVLRFSAH